MQESQRIKNHREAARKLRLIVDQALKLIKSNIGKISEYDVQKFILEEFNKRGLLTVDPVEIVAINKNAAIPHYYPSQKRSEIIRRNDLILIDIWARLKNDNSFYADITWMAYVGKNVPIRIEETFKKIIGARDYTTGFIKDELKSKKIPRTKAVEKSARDYLKKFDLEKFFIHGTGHSLGLSFVHGTYFRFSKKSKAGLKLEIPFTIEPGLYFKNEFGIRSEINCYITNDYKLVITTDVQKEIIKI